MAHDASSSSTRAGSSTRFLRRSAWMLSFGVLGLLGLAATTALQVYIDPSIVERSTLPAGTSLPTVVLASVATPALLAVAAAVVGTAAAPRAGFRSLVHDHARRGVPVLERLRASAPRAIVAGFATGVALVVLDVVLPRLVPAASVAGANEGSVALVLASAPARFLYGGLAEELMLRWALVSLLAVAFDAVVPGERRGVVVWGAVVVAAVAFGAAHLPTAAASTTLTVPVVVRIVALNAVGGIVFGWLFVSESLEAAMLAHATAHVPLLAAAVLSVA